MLKLRIKIERVDHSEFIEVIGIANSGFIGVEPEVLVPSSIAQRLKLHKIGEPELHTKITGDGREVTLIRYKSAVNVYIVTEDRIEGPIKSNILVLPRARYVLLNDKLLGKLKVVLIDFGEGIWCFRDELGKRERRSIS